MATSGRYQNQVEREYDIGGRLIGEWLIGQGNSALPGAWSVWYGYDAANRVRTLTYPNGTEVTRDYTARHQLEAVTHGGTAVANRTYDAAGKLTQTVLGNGLIETRDYVPGSYLVETIEVPGLTEFGYGYDANGRKLTESQTATLLSQVQTFGYDAQDRLTSWSQDAGVVPAQTQSWNLTLVGDWQSTTRDGVLEARQHTDVHEVTRIKVGAGPNRRLHYDAKGNLTKDDANRRYTWDPENRLQTARTPKAVSPTGQNLRSAYVYDALGRRVAKTVNGRVTRFIHAGAQVIQEEDGQAVAPPAERASDGAVADLAEEPASGGILPASSDPSAPVLRVNFQPRTTVIPPGFLADKGKTFAARTNGLSYGWSANLQNQDRIQRFAASLEEWDTFLRAARPGRPQRTWRIALPNGTYPVIVVAGDAVSRNHTNHLIIGGIPVTDPDPATMDTGYELGDFDGYAVQATVTDGVLTIAPGVGAFDPTVCFIEIGPEGTTITPDVEARLADVVELMTTATFAPQAPSLARRQYVFGTYVDELLAYTVGATRYFTHSNHLYSIAAVTDGTGAVVERYTYDAYGKRTVLNAAGTVELAQSAVSQNRGFTGYIFDSETGWYHARRRPYSPTLGRFPSRDPLGHIDGQNLYRAYFIPRALDPFGLYEVEYITEEIFKEAYIKWEYKEESGEKDKELVCGPCHEPDQGIRQCWYQSTKVTKKSRRKNVHQFVEVWLINKTLEDYYDQLTGPEAGVGALTMTATGVILNRVAEANLGGRAGPAAIAVGTGIGLAGIYVGLGGRKQTRELLDVYDRVVNFGDWQMYESLTEIVTSTPWVEPCDDTTCPTDMTFD